MCCTCSGGGVFVQVSTAHQLTVFDNGLKIPTFLHLVPRPVVALSSTLIQQQTNAIHKGGLLVEIYR